MPATPAKHRQPEGSKDPVAQMMAALLPVHRAVTIDWLADAAATAAERGLGAPFAFVYIEQQDGRLDYLAPASDLRRRSHERANAPFGGKLRRKIEPATSPLLTDALETSAASTISPAELYDDIDDVAAHAARKSLGVDRVALVPLETAGERIGAMAVFVARETDDELLRLLGDHVACAIANLRSAEAAREHGVTDVVRSVFDERKLERDLQRELSRTTRTQRPVSIVVLQATNLRLLREQYGKFLADRLLQRLGEALAEHSRDIDIIGAYKDSGYTMVLSEAHSEGAAIAARRLLEMAQQVRLDSGDVPGLELHLAAGWATCPSDGTTTDSMFAAAEVRMYGAAA
ncbi:MAG TPA: diguanylate cyclase [Dehalococcoidia bacterium]|nr:diguanylate cyclase [Dehalococcoidia bacterium]